ncbi:MAG: 16S rRNA (guanine(966)-N(2))-methyltransferase RsmD [Clostridia bacterium]|nr:16S rRNA (guanine(966)-N(2))-methyltransferase RsmD [Clostridia bacterium]
MRVIAGTARSLKLKAPIGTDTRPTYDRTKETLFNVLMPWISQSRFLDLYSGSGAIGIEAISRGAKEAYFVEKSPEAVKIIEDNISHCKFDSQSNVMRMDTLMALRHLEGKGAFDIIFMDPPFNKGMEFEVLKYLQSSDLLHEDTLIVVEASNDTDFSDLDQLGFNIIKEKIYKTNQHIFMTKECTNE